MALSSRPTSPEVLKWMKDLNDWFSVGEKVGVPFSKLQALEDKYPLDSERARKEMVDLWLERDANPTWAKLADGMECASQRALARKIRETYNCPKRANQTRSVNHRRHESPHAKKSAPPSGPATTYPHPPFSPPTTSPPPYRMSSRSFECYCREFTPAMKHGSSISDGSSKPSIFLPNLRVSKSQRTTIETKLKKESNEMNLRFGGFVKRFLRSLKSRSVSVSTLVKCLLGIKAFCSDNDHTPFFQHRYKQLKSAYTVDEVILIVSDYISFFNHSLLVNLVKDLGSDDDQEELDIFLTYFEMFARRGVFKMPMYMYGYTWVKTEMLIVLQTDILGESCSVKDLHDFHQRLCDVLRVLPHALHVCRVDEESLELVCRMPPHVVEEVFPLSSEQELALSTAGLVQLHCPDYCFSMIDPAQLSYDSEEVAECSDIMSVEEESSDPVKNNNGSSALYTSDESSGPHYKRGRKDGRAGAKRDRQLDEAFVGQLKTCCHYHEQMNYVRNQSRTLVTQGDMGYDGDSETSTEEGAALEAYPNLPIRHSRKRLKWRLTYSQF